MGPICPSRSRYGRSCKATVFADASFTSVLNAISSVALGDTGKAVVDANFDIGKLAKVRCVIRLSSSKGRTDRRTASRVVRTRSTSRRNRAAQLQYIADRAWRG